MGKIVFFCIAAHGHTNPTLGVVRELVLRGHEVLYYSYGAFKNKIRETGATYISCDEYDAGNKLTPEDGARIGTDIAFSTKILVDTTLALDDMVCRTIGEFKPDCIVADSMAYWGKAASLKLGIPFISSTTTFAFNQYSSRIMKQSPGQLFKMIFSMPSVNRDIKRLQDKGYPVSSILSLIQNDNETDTIVYTSAEFQPCADTFSDKYSFVGPTVRTIPRKEPGERKCIYISMGTVNNLLLDFYRNCIEALKSEPFDVIMSVGEATDIGTLGEIPANFRVEHRVDQIEVLAGADVFISHCGMNSVSESLYYEVPLVLYPQTTEQGGVARRVFEVGAGIYLDKNKPGSIREAVQKVLADDTYRKNAAAVSESFRKCGGASMAADAIERKMSENV